MKKQLDVMLALAGSGWSLAQHAREIWEACLAYGPGVLTMVYVGLKIYYKVKRERDRKRFRWEDEEE